MAYLYSEIKVKDRVIKNRIVLPPVVRFGWSDDNGFVSARHIEHYEKIAKSGTGLIILEATAIRKEGRLALSQLGIWSDEQIEGLSKIVAACRKHGAEVLIQIHDAGMKTAQGVTEDIVGPSDITRKGVTARALTKEEIYEIKNRFVEAAKRAEKAGFSGIEIHGAHNYLLDQFMSPITNKREDEYGGSLENRMRFALEVIEGIKEAVSPEFIIGYRFGGNAPTLGEGRIIAKALENKGVDLLHVSWGIFDEITTEVPAGFQYNWIVYLGTEIKKEIGIPVIVVNGIRTPKEASYLIENDLADFVALARAHLADPEWAHKALNGGEIKTCLHCRRCQWYVDGDKCPRNINGG